MMTSGTILIEKDTLRPQCFQAYSKGHGVLWPVTSGRFEMRKGEKQWYFSFGSP